MGLPKESNIPYIIVPTQSVNSLYSKQCAAGAEDPSVDNMPEGGRDKGNGAIACAKCTALLALVISLASVAALVTLYFIGHAAPFDYALVFDAGSTHTEMLLYKWQADKYFGTGVVEEIHTCDMKGGIGVKLRENPARLTGDYFKRCIQEGQDLIPVHRRNHSRIFLAATAGMRLVKSEDPEAAEQILGNVSRLMERTGLLCHSCVQIISGKEEAISAWVSANYLLKNIYPKPDEMVGVLDMGGASTQITFLNDSVDSAFSNSIYDSSLQLYGNRHELYGRSYMCMGQNQMYNKYFVKRSRDSFGGTPGSRLNSPCHNRDYEKTIQYNDVNNYCSEWQYTNSYVNRTVMVVGSGEYDNCRENVRSLVLNSCSTFTHSENCFNPPLRPPQSTHFIAISGFYYVLKNLKLDKEHPSLSTYRETTKRYCEMSFSEVVAALDNNEEYATSICFNAQYLDVLLTEAYGITEEVWSNIQFLNKINGSSLGWALGFTIRVTNAFPEGPVQAQFSEVILVILLFILALVIGLSIATLCIMPKYEKLKNAARA